jgi:hypothetical protein
MGKYEKSSHFDLFIHWKLIFFVLSFIVFELIFLLENSQGRRKNK